MDLFVTYITKPGRREEFLRRLSTAGVVDAIRKETGCRRYDYYLSCQDENEILLVEEWDSEEAQRIHMTQPHMQTLMQIKDDCVLDARLQKR